MNHCKWLMIGSTIPCNKSCRSEFCGSHLQSVQRGSFGPLPCLRCGVGVKGKSQLCLSCGSKRYRELKRYYDKRDGVVRHCRLKKPVGQVNHHGYLRFTAGKKRYFCHRIVYEAFYGSIKDGLVIDHIDSCPLNNKLEILQAISQSQNAKKGSTGTCKSSGKRPVKSFDLETKEEKLFHSMNAAEKHFDICRASIRFVAEGIYQTAISKKNAHRIKFSYHQLNHNLFGPLMDGSD